MKKALIISGVLVGIVAILGGVWWYLFMNGTPESLQQFNPFSTPEAGTTFQSGTSTPEIDVEAAPREFETTLRALTTNPVAGAGFYNDADGTRVRYVERGTGHIFSVDPKTGATTRLVQETVPRTVEAIFSPQGTRAAVEAETAEGQRRVFAGSIVRTDDGSTTFDSIEINPRAENLSFAADGERLYYTVSSDAGSVGYAHNLRTGERTTLFNSILRDIAVVWEPVRTIYTTPSAYADGYAYSGDIANRITGNQQGLMAVPTENHTVLSYMTEEGYTSFVDRPGETPLPIAVFPEKCDADPTDGDILWCGAPLALAAGSYPDDWYQGSVSLADIIWRVNLSSGSAALVSVPSTDAREDIDVTDMHTNEDASMLIFTNKIDGVLWVQEVE